MGIFTALSKSVQAFLNEMNTPQCRKIGQDFENYVRQSLFIDRYYDLLERTHDSHTDGNDFVASALKPDFHFRDGFTGKEFYVAAQFRPGFYNGKIQWCKEHQLVRYQEYNKQRPVFLLLGMGEEAKRPEFLSLIPLSVAKYTGLFPSVAEKYEIAANKPVTSRTLWNR